MSDHAKFSPSAAKRWLACPASWLHNLADDSPSSPEAAEGTRAHAVAELCLDKGVSPTSLVGSTFSVEIDGTDNAFPLTAEMAEHVEVYTEHCRTLSMLCDYQLVEEKVTAPLSVNGVVTPDYLWGTADYCAVSLDDRIDIVDLKYGYLEVDPRDNPQGAAYLLGALNMSEVRNSDIKSAAIHIIQPRVSREPRIWEIDDIAAFKTEWTKRFEDAVERCLEVPSPPREDDYCAGEHCRFCFHLPLCMAFADKALVDAQEELGELGVKGTPDFNSVPIETLLERFKMKKVIEHYYKMLEQYLKQKWSKGDEVPGYKVVHSMGIRKWMFPKEEMVKKLRAQGLKQDQYLEKKLLGPAKLEKILSESFMERHVGRSLSGESLVPTSDRREPIRRLREELDDIETSDDLDDLLG